MLSRKIHFFVCVSVLAIVLLHSCGFVITEQKYSATLKITNDDTVPMNVELESDDVSISGDQDKYFSLGVDDIGIYTLLWEGNSVDGGKTSFMLISVRSGSSTHFETEKIELSSGDTLIKKITDFDWKSGI